MNIYNNVIAENTAVGISTTTACCPSPSISASNNIITGNGTYGMSYSRGSFSSFYNNLWDNASGSYNGSISKTGDTQNAPLFLSATDYHISSASPCINSGRPITADNDPDGTRNDQGAYGGPFAADFWPYPAGGPVVTNLTVTPPSVPVGGTITIKATGEIR